jgi:hypothetical protein
MSGEILIKPGEPGEAVLFSVDARGRSHEADADDLGLTDELGERIEEWCDALDAAFDEDAPGLRSFESDAARRAFAAEGRAIAAAIQDELGEEWTVTVDFSPWESGLA